MLDNPEVFGTMGRYSPIYQANIHAEPCRDMGPAAEYSRDELHYFRADFRGKRQVDEALAQLGDISLQAEVRRYCASMEVIAELEAAIKKLEDDIYVHVDRVQHSVTRGHLEQAGSIVIEYGKGDDESLPNTYQGSVDDD
ncbi:hypothetical protein EI94DRAFT_1696922 [Lactarius quietus]|nr:hypothetical protein EI94DRAFT_1696922 [Lactarius quietus]